MQSSVFVGAYDEQVRLILGRSNALCLHTPSRYRPLQYDCTGKRSWGGHSCMGSRVSLARREEPTWD